jgi:uncharacterized protein (DUF433 family)
MSKSETVIRAFSAGHVVRVTGLTPSQLRYWDATGFFQPAYAHVDGETVPVRLYSFTDLVGLRVLQMLRSTYKVPLTRLRIAAKELAKYSRMPWAELKIVVCNREVSFIEPDTGHARSVSGQYIILPVLNVINYVENSVEKLNTRTKDQIGKTTKNRNISHNAEVLAGTRVPVKAIHKFLDYGYDIEKILEEYPSVEKRDIEVLIEARMRSVAA